jgi:hypothetical protein
MMTELMMTAKLCATKTMTKPKPNRALYRLSRQPFWLGWRFCFCQGDNHTLCKLLSLLGRFYAGVILGFLGDVGVQKKTKGFLSSLFLRSLQK